MQQRIAYIEKMKQELDALNLRLIALELAADQMQLEARDRYEIEVKKVRAQSVLAKEKLTALIESSESSWHQMVAETEKIRDAFLNSFSYFKSQI